MRNCVLTVEEKKKERKYLTERKIDGDETQKTTSFSFFPLTRVHLLLI